MAKKSKRLSAKRVIALVTAFLFVLSGMPLSSITAQAAVKKPTIAKSATLKVGQTKTVKISKGSYKIVSIKVSSSKKSIAAVKASGKTAIKVTAKKAGKATITTRVKAKKGKTSKTFKLTTKVTVKKEKEPKPVTETSKTVNTQEELNAALADASITQITIGEEATSITIPSGDYSNVDLIVDAPKASIVNNGTFKSITIKAVAANTWTEQGADNAITVVNNNPVRIIVATAKKLASLVFTGSSIQTNIVQIKSGTLANLAVTSKEPVKVEVEGASKVGTVSVQSSAKVDVAVSDTAMVSAVEVTGAGATVGVNASDNAKIDRVDVASSANSASVNVKAEGSSSIKEVTTSAANSVTNVTANDKATVATVDVNGTANASISGTSNNVTVVDVKDASNTATVTVNTQTVKVETKAGNDTEKIINNQSGQVLTTEVTGTDGKTTQTTTKTDTAAGGDEAGGGSIGGGSSSVSVTSVTIDGVTAVGEMLTAIIDPDSASSVSCAWYTGSSSDGPWTRISGQTTNKLTLTDAMFGKYIKVTAGGKEAITKGTVAVAVGNHVIAVTQARGGTITSSANQAAEDTVITLTATPSKGYTFGRWAVNGAVVGVSASETFPMPSNDVTVTATFIPISYTMIYNTNEGGDAPSSVYFDVAHVFTFADKGEMTKENSVFVGWSLSKTATKATWISGATLTADEVLDLVPATGTEVTAYAVWQTAEAAKAALVTQITGLPTEAQIGEYTTTAACETAKTAITEAQEAYSAAESEVQTAVEADTAVAGLIGEDTVDTYLMTLSGVCNTRKTLIQTIDNIELSSVGLASNVTEFNATDLKASVKELVESEISASANGYTVAVTSVTDANPTACTIVGGDLTAVVTITKAGYTRTIDDLTVVNPMNKAYAVAKEDIDAINVTAGVTLAANTNTLPTTDTVKGLIETAISAETNGYTVAVTQVVDPETTVLTKVGGNLTAKVTISKDGYTRPINDYKVVNPVDTAYAAAKEAIDAINVTAGVTLEENTNTLPTTDTVKGLIETAVSATSNGYTVVVTQVVDPETTVLTKAGGNLTAKVTISKGGYTRPINDYKVVNPVDEAYATAKKAIDAIDVSAGVELEANTTTLPTTDAVKSLIETAISASVNGYTVAVASVTDAEPSVLTEVGGNLTAVVTISKDGYTRTIDDYRVVNPADSDYAAAKEAIDGIDCTSVTLGTNVTAFYAETLKGSVKSLVESAFISVDGAVVAVTSVTDANPSACTVEGGNLTAVVTIRKDGYTRTIDNLTVVNPAEVKTFDLTTATSISIGDISGVDASAGQPQDVTTSLEYITVDGVNITPAEGGLQALCYCGGGSWFVQVRSLSNSNVYKKVVVFQSNTGKGGWVNVT